MTDWAAVGTETFQLTLPSKFSALNSADGLMYEIASGYFSFIFLTTWNALLYNCASLIFVLYFLFSLLCKNIQDSNSTYKHTNESDNCYKPNITSAIFFMIGKIGKHEHADSYFLHLKSLDTKNSPFVCFLFSVECCCFFLHVSCHSNYCAWSSPHRFDRKLNSVFSEQMDGALLQRGRPVKVSEGPVSVKRTWPLSCISMFAGAYKGIEKKRFPLRHYI